MSHSFTVHGLQWLTQTARRHMLRRTVAGMTDFARGQLRQNAFSFLTLKGVILWFVTGHFKLLRAKMFDLNWEINQVK